MEDVFTKQESFVYTFAQFEDWFIKIHAPTQNKQ